MKHFLVAFAFAVLASSMVRTQQPNPDTSQARQTTQAYYDSVARTGMNTTTSTVSRKRYPNAIKTSPTYRTLGMSDVEVIEIRNANSIVIKKENGNLVIGILGIWGPKKDKSRIDESVAIATRMLINKKIDLINIDFPMDSDKKLIKELGFDFLSVAFIDGVNVALKLVSAGAAECSDFYAPLLVPGQLKICMAIQKKAKKTKVGIWMKK